MKIKNISLILIVILLAILLAACGSSEEAAESAQSAGGSATLTVGSQSFTAADLEAMPQTQSAFSDVTYLGVSVTELLSAAGYDLASLKAVKAVASDGYSVNYDVSQLSAENVIVAYAQADGPLSADDGDFRMVLPDQEGKLNLRMLVELQVVE